MPVPELQLAQLLEVALVDEAAETATLRGSMKMDNTAGHQVEDISADRIGVDKLVGRGQDKTVFSGTLQNFRPNGSSEQEKVAVLVFKGGEQAEPAGLCGGQRPQPRRRAAQSKELRQRHWGHRPVQLLESWRC